MKAIFKKEFRGYLTSMTGYVCIAFVLAFIGIYFTAYNLTYCYPYFSYAISSSTFIFFIVVPLLTMRALAEEKKHKTDQLLLTAPVKVTDIVLGKYLAIVAVFAVPIAIVCLYPLILHIHGTDNMAMDYTGIFGFFLMGCAYLAVGMFLSSVTESQIIAAVLSCAFLFFSQVVTGIADFFGDTASTSLICLIILVIVAAVVLYMLTRHTLLSVGAGTVGEIAVLICYTWKSEKFEGLIQNMLSIFDVNSHLSSFSEGLFDLTGVVYFASIIIIALVLTVQSIQKRRWS